MKLLYVTSRYPKTSETFVAREMNRLRELGHEITICRLKWPPLRPAKEATRVRGARVVDWQFSPAAWARGLAWAVRTRPRVLRDLWADVRATGGSVLDRVKLVAILLTTLANAQRLQGEGIQHIRAHFLHSPAVGAMWLSRLLEAPYSVTAQTLDLRFPRSLVEKLVRRSAFAAATTQETDGLLERLGARPEQTLLVRSGIPVEEFEMRSALPLEAPPVILAVGRLVEKKGFDRLVRACALLKERGASFTARIVGGGPLYDDLQTLITTLGVNDRVTLTGALPFEEVQQEFRQARVLAMPSQRSTDGSGRDGLPNVLMEGMAFGVPSVATRFAAIPELVKHEATGLLVDPQAQEQLADALHRVLEDDALARRLAEAGRAKIERAFSLAREVEKLEARIRQTVHPESAPSQKHHA